MRRDRGCKHLRGLFEVNGFDDVGDEEDFEEAVLGCGARADAPPWKAFRFPEAVLEVDEGGEFEFLSE